MHGIHWATIPPITAIPAREIKVMTTISQILRLPPARLYRAGRKSMGYRIVVFGTPSLGPKLNFLTLATIWEVKSGASILHDSTPQAETTPLGSIEIRSTIF